LLEIHNGVEYKADAHVETFTLDVPLAGALTIRYLGAY
jgi:hypothetical protein